jgi:hypothetical protein
MTVPPPTLAELRRRELHGQDARIGNVLARRFARPTAIYGTWLAVRLGMSAHRLTVASLLAALAGAVCLASGTRLGFVAGAVLGLLAFWLDRVDGQVARWRGTAGLNGVYLDYMMHHAATMALGFALGFGLAARTGTLGWAAAGFLVSAGWMFLSLQNDCRYKAFFQPLKRSSGAFRVEGGAGGRPAPAPPWPRRGLGMLTWPAYKSCEPHVVLMTLLGLAIVAGVEPIIWEWGWQAYVAGMALLAPSLATARIARAIHKGAVEEEFARWFRPEPVGLPPGSSVGRPLLTGCDRSARMDG